MHGPGKPGEQRRSALDSTLAQRELGWQPRVSLADGLAQTVAAFREAGVSLMRAWVAQACRPVPLQANLIMADNLALAGAMKNTPVFLVKGG